ncbi:Sulfotransferase domain containing protein [Parasponia andersonii]|uniref:Sulfotransferase n=1 Tax=Parasponia andersonii TaxID=3476 RepID=A0A2P5ANZ1_PARAD|nr:Sulfotransferase domain containing protein [Parasponia andersonii]
MESSTAQEHGNEMSDDQIDQDQKELFLSQLTKTKGWLGSSGLSFYQGFWCPSKIVPNIISFQNHFKSHDQDIILASKPKSGTTWLKALLFSIVNRASTSISNTPLLRSNPHELVPFFEFTLYANNNKIPDLSNIPFPRLFSTHIPYDSLSKSIKESKCRILYICRNPLDTIVSHWHFANQADHLNLISKWTLEEFVDVYCKGEEVFGPFWDHILGYWKQGLEHPRKVMFFKYEDLKKDTKTQVRKLAEFVGYPFSMEEESLGIVDEILKLCSFKNLKDLDVNKHGKFMPYFENKSYFRKGEVGDWVNHLSPTVADQVEKLIHEKFSSSGLTL